MIPLILTIVACLQLTNTYLYNKAAGDTRWWLLPLFLTITITSNLLWFYLAKMTPDKAKLMTVGFIWDLQAILAVVIIPVVFFSFKATPVFWIGAAVCSAGIIIMKLAS